MPAVYNLVWGFVQKALRTWAYVVHAASSLALVPRPSEASGPPALCVAYEGGDAPEPTLAPSYSASRSWQPEASGPPGHPGKCEGGDVPEPVADTAPDRFPPYVFDRRFFKERSGAEPWVRCDGCHIVTYGSGKGSFVARTCAVPAGDRRRLWAIGQMDARWYCLQCWADYAGRPLEAMWGYLGWDRCPPYVHDHRFLEERSGGRVRCDGCDDLFYGSGNGSFVARTCAVPAGDRRRLWAMGQLDGRWYCLDCWADHAGRPVKEMSEYLGWTGRDAKWIQYLQRLQRKPHRIDRADQRFSNPSLQTRLIFCDFPRCMKPCKGVQSGYFLTAKLPALSQRQALWESGSLDMTFYCSSHYQEVMGQAAPAWTKKRQKAKAWHRAAQQCSGTRDGGRSTDRQ